jgi:hypothetical protein
LSKTYRKIPRQQGVIARVALNCNVMISDCEIQAGSCRDAQIGGKTEWE